MNTSDQSESVNKFVQLLDTFPNGNTIISKYLPPYTDFFFTDQLLNEETLEVVRNNNYRLGITSQDFGYYVPDVFVDIDTKTVTFYKNLITVITSYYNIGNQVRKAEIETAILKNVNNPLVKEVILVCENVHTPFIHPKIKEVFFTRQPLYSDFFELANKQTGAVMITNSDIELATTSLTRVPDLNEVFTLTRQELDGRTTFIDNYELYDSHDSYMFFPPLRIDYNEFKFPQNKWGSENVVNYKLFTAGYRLSNPCRSIITIHHHQSEIREPNRERINNNTPFIRVFPS